MPIAAIGSGRAAGRLTYAMRLPLAEAIRVEPAAETREVWLDGRRSAAGRRCPWPCRNGAAMSAAASWRPRTTGWCSGNDGLGQNLYAPLLIDLDRKRARSKA